MKRETEDLAIVSNHSFAASKVVNLHHYDISSALQTTLEFAELIDLFSNKILHLIPHTGYSYENIQFKLDIKKGIVTKHSCAYALKVESLSLGSLKLMRQQRFSDAEIKLLETLLCTLIYPLKNASIYQQVLTMAYTDSLTQTNNRTAFNASIAREMSLAHRNANHLSVIFLDIDHFKHINDSFGHNCGDMALSSVAHCIIDTVRESDIVFRYGGEEFVILLSNTDLDGAQIMAGRILECIENHTLAYGMNFIKFTASMGVSSLRRNDSIDSFVKRADQAMYHAKQNGRNQIQSELMERAL